MEFIIGFSLGVLLLFWVFFTISMVQADKISKDILKDDE